MPYSVLARGRFRKRKLRVAAARTRVHKLRTYATY